MIFADLALAKRLEAAEALAGEACTLAQREAASRNIGGGRAIYVGPHSPLTHAVGLGLNGPVRDAELEELEAFFRSRGAAVSIDLCPLADQSMLDWISSRQYRATEFNNVLVRPLAGAEMPAREPAVRVALPEEAERWARIAAMGFFERTQFTEEESQIGLAIFRMPGTICYFAVEGTEPAASAAIHIHEGVATLFADSTTPNSRRRGWHGALIRARLREAISRGCDLATASTSPGSLSQRNYERAEFRVAYTKTVFIG